MSEYRGRIALGGLLVVVLTVGLVFELNSAVSGGTTTGQSSSAQISTTKTGVIAAGANTSTIGPNGTLLSAFINAREIAVGQNLNISISLYNTLPTVITLGVSSDWVFSGVPVATWAPCTDPFLGWPLPIDVVVLNGNYTAQELPAIANVSFSSCTPGLGFYPLSFTFEPNSAQANLTYGASATPEQHIGPVQLSSGFTLSGYWNLTSLSEEGHTVPILVNATSTPSSIPFVPGVYTIGVADEWGQFVLLHFQVSGSG